LADLVRRSHSTTFEPAPAGTLEPRYVKGNWIGKDTFGSGSQNPCAKLGS